MGKNTHLVNIYLKIHNNKMLTMDDLSYLAEYDPECFMKTCKNVVYNIPETKDIMEPLSTEPYSMELHSKELNSVETSSGEAFNEERNRELFDRKSIEEILDNLRSLEMEDSPIANIDTGEVKSLLGNLYMELLFPHNDKNTFWNMKDNENISSFDRKA